MLQSPTPSLLQILRLPDDADPERIRYTYEQQVADATRRGDWVRARQLSAAFDDFRTTASVPIYSAHATRGVVYADEAAGQMRNAQRSERPSATRRTRRQERGSVPQCGMRWPFKILAALIGILSVGCVLVSMIDGRGAGAAGSSPLFGRTVSATPRLDAAAVATELDRLRGVDDISCVGSTSSSWTCSAPDGSSWLAQRTGPTDNLTFRQLTPSVYLSSARHDAQVVAGGIQECLSRGGTLPAARTIQSMHADFSCGDSGSMRMYLSASNAIEYAPTGSTSYVLTVTAANGEMVRYDSRTRRFT